MYKHLERDERLTSEVLAGYQVERGASSGFSSINGMLWDLMENEKLFLDPELTSYELARRMNIHRNTLSLLINHYYGSSCRDFINTYRIREAKRILGESIQKRKFLKMWRICLEAGFNSSATYYRVFKRFVGCTPVEYKSRLECAGTVVSTRGPEARQG